MGKSTRLTAVTWGSSPDLPEVMSSSNLVHPPHPHFLLLPLPGRVWCLSPCRGSWLWALFFTVSVVTRESSHPLGVDFALLHFFFFLSNSWRQPSFKVHKEACSVVGWCFMTVTYGCVHCVAVSVLFKVLLRKPISHTSTLHMEGCILLPLDSIKQEVLVTNHKYYTHSRFW